VHPVPAVGAHRGDSRRGRRGWRFCFGPHRGVGDGGRAAHRRCSRSGRQQLWGSSGLSGERVKRGLGVLWRSSDGRGAFYRADKGELGHQRVGGRRRNDRPLWLLIWGIQEMNSQLMAGVVGRRDGVAGGGSWWLQVAQGGT
jgi:hypothetical protein